MTTQQLQQLADKHRGEKISLFEAVQREQNAQLSQTSQQPAKTLNSTTGRETRHDNEFQKSRDILLRLSNSDKERQQIDNALTTIKDFSIENCKKE